MASSISLPPLPVILIVVSRALLHEVLRQLFFGLLAVNRDRARQSKMTLTEVALLRVRVQSVVETCRNLADRP